MARLDRKISPLYCGWEREEKKKTVCRQKCDVSQTLFLSMSFKLQKEELGNNDTFLNFNISVGVLLNLVSTELHDSC